MQAKQQSPERAIVEAHLSQQLDDSDPELLQEVINEVEMAVRFIKEADYIIISAGAGLSASVGLDYTSEEVFADLYPAMHALGFRCMYQFIGRLPISEELKWGYLLTHVNKARFNWGPTRLYTQLRQLAQSKGADRYFVKTSNADGFFAQSGFDLSRVFTPQGDYSNMQCLNAEGDSHRSGAPAVFPTRPFVESALPHIDTARTMEIVEPKAMPRCPHCGGSVFFNVRGGDWFIESPYREARRAYERFLEHALADATASSSADGGKPEEDETKRRKKTIAILEIGAGFNTPGVLRWPNERLVMQNECVRLVRLNRDHPEVPDTTSSSGAIRAVGLPLDAALVVPLFLS